jgi:hypothetical protein
LTAGRQKKPPYQLGGDDAVSRHPPEDFSIALGELWAANAPP